MIIYTLTCINEDYEVLTVKVYTTREEAQKAMREEYEAYRSCFYTEDTLVGAEITEWYARVNYGATEHFFYDWSIIKTELAI